MKSLELKTFKMIEYDGWKLLVSEENLERFNETNYFMNKLELSHLAMDPYNEIVKNYWSK